MKHITMLICLLSLVLCLFAGETQARNIPRTNDLLFATLASTLPASGATGPWACYEPAGVNLDTMSTPTVQTIGGEKCEQNVQNDGDGYRFGGVVTVPIPVAGVTIAAAMIPTRDTEGNWSSIVDIFYGNMCLVVKNNSGLVGVKRNNLNFWAAGGTEIPEGQITILSLVVQTNGTFKVRANGVEIMDVTDISTFTALTPGPAGHEKNINVGRNNPDGWTTFSGNIGDVFVYKVALSDTERDQLEADINTNFLSKARTTVAAATDIQQTTVTLNGELVSEGLGGSPDVWACYGTADGGYDTSAWQNVVSVGTGVTAGPISKGISGLTPGTTYNITFFASSTTGETFSDETGSFSTMGIPVISNRPAASVHVTTARARGYLVSTGFAATTVKLYHGTTDGGTTPGSWDVEVDLGVKDAGALDVLLTGVSGTHYYRFYAENGAGGTWASGNESFTTDTAFNPTGYGKILSVNFVGYTETEQLLDYPALIELNETITGFLYSDFLSVSSPAADIRFVSADGSELSYEIDTWNMSGSSYIWVEVPVLTSNAQIRMYYSKAGDTAPAYTTDGSTWNDGFVAVWHMTNNLSPNATGNSAYDVNGGDSLGNIVDGAGQIGICRDFIPYSRLQAGDVDLPTTGFTLSYWVSLDDNQGDRWNIQKNNSYSLMDRYGWWEFNINNWIYGGWGAWATFASENTTWVYVSGTYDGSSIRIYKNGDLQETKPQTGMTQSDDQMYIGQNVDGKLDEVRAHAVPRSADWLKADYENQSAPQTFGAYAVVPEPAAIGLLTLAGLLAFRRRRAA